MPVAFADWDKVGAGLVGVAANCFALGRFRGSGW